MRKYLVNLKQEKRISVQQQFNEKKHLLILGDPGSGKSTFVNFVTFILAQANLTEKPKIWLDRLNPWQHGKLLPVRVILRDFADSLKKGDKPGAQLLLNYLQHDLTEWKIDNFWHRLNEHIRQAESPLLILFDGLDEVAAEFRDLIVETVNDFVATFSQHRYLVTCRPYAYIGQSCRLVLFHEVTLAPFSEKQIENFIHGWYNEQAKRKRFSENDAKTRAAKLIEATRRKDLAGMAERPLLLTVMAVLHTWRGQLPEDRVELYAGAVDLLLRRWQGRFGKEEGILEELDIPGLKMANLEAGIYEAAFNAHAQTGDREVTADISEGDLIVWLKPHLGNNLEKAQTFVDYIRERAGLLIRLKHGTYTFPHRTFQEFLAACHLVRQPDFVRESTRLVTSDPVRWREVFLMAAGRAARRDMPGAAISAVNALCPENCDPAKQPKEENFSRTFLASETLKEIGSITLQGDAAGQALLDRLCGKQGWLVSAIKADDQLKPQQRVQAGNLLAEFGDPRFNPDMFFLPAEPQLGFVEIPAGKFNMGTNAKDIPGLLKKFGGDKNWYEREVPQHEVDVPRFYLCRYPVTEAQFKYFVENSGHKPSDERYFKGIANHPVVYVTWYDAQAYCQWLTEMLKKSPQTPLEIAELIRDKNWRISLPGEAQWEKAARGNDGRNFPWGNEITSNFANFGETNINTTSPVGCFPFGKSLFSLLDMSGNVFEWTQSVYKQYPYNSNDGREKIDADRNTARVLRGGAFYNNPWDVRCACRYGDDPNFRYYDFGFRLALSPGF